MMRQRMIRWVMAMMLLCGWCHTAAFAYGYNQNAQSKSWGYQSTYDPNVSAPTYRFRTTSVYINSSGDTDAGGLMSRNNGPRRSPSPWDWDDEDDPIGVVPDPTPVGDTPWWFMLLLAAGYIALRPFRQHKAQV